MAVTALLYSTKHYNKHFECCFIILTSSFCNSKFFEPFVKQIKLGLYYNYILMYYLIYVLFSQNRSFKGTLTIHISLTQFTEHTHGGTLTMAQYIDTIRP